MNRHIAVILTACLSAASCATAAGRVERRYSSTSDTPVPGISLVVDSVDFRKDLTRMYGRIVGHPNTAQRIDSLLLSIGTGKKSLPATDIDGVDFKRWFQWEENGEIGLEIDFAPIVRIPERMELKALTPKGPVIWTIVRQSRGKRK